MSACEAYETNTGTSELTPSDDYEQEHGAAYSYVTTTLAHLQGVQTQSRGGAFSRGDDHSLKQREQWQKETTEEEEEVYNKSYNKHVCVCVCVRASVRNGRSPEVIRPPGKCHFFLWGMATVGQREGVQ